MFVYTFLAAISSFAIIPEPVTFLLHELDSFFLSDGEIQLVLEFNKVFENIIQCMS